MSVLSFIASSNFIVVNKELIKQLGLEEAILVGELASEYDYWTKKEELNDGYFFSTIENVEESTGLSEFKQRKAFKILQEKGIIDLKIKGIPAKRYVKINEEQVLKLIDSKLFNNSRTSSLKIKELDVEKLKGNNNITNNNIINKNNNNKEIYKEEFETLWKLYPKKQGKENAYKDFIKSRKNTSYEEIEKGLNNYLYYIKINKIDTQYIKNGSTWFHQHCWEDDYTIKKELTTKDLAEYMDFSEFRE